MHPTWDLRTSGFYRFLLFSTCIPQTRGNSVSLPRDQTQGAFFLLHCFHSSMHYESVSRAQSLRFHNKEKDVLVTSSTPVISKQWQCCGPSPKG